MKLLILFAIFFFSVTAIAGDFPPDDPDPYPPKPSYEYDCTLKAETSRSETFRYRSDADKFCKNYSDDSCKVEQLGRYKYQAKYSYVVDIKYISEESWGHARVSTLILFAQYIEENEHYNENYKHSFNYDTCYGEPTTEY